MMTKTHAHASQDDTNFYVQKGSTFRSETISNWINKLATIKKNRHSIYELERLSDRELNDIGIARGDIRRVVKNGNT